jgi:oxygen-independent coproporphyrinogen-3 oxidase
LSGIYIHIPFCRKACDYCDFHFSTSPGLKGRMISAICRELELRSQKDWVIRTVYFGGGTPSLLSAGELQAIMEAVSVNYSVSQDAEITFEANPDDITKASLNNWKKAGINRLSVGVQSFINRDLRYMGRIHDSAKAEESIEMAMDAGIHNINVDLIYGTPGLTPAEWEMNLKKAVSLGVSHISAYALTVEENTPLFHRIRKKQKAAPDENVTADQFIFLSQFLQEQGYEHYEVSNFCKPGMHSRHNSSYWEGLPYWGIGPSAHSFDGQKRRMNVANNARYIKSLEDENTLLFEEEILTGDDHYNEFLLTRLRTSKGLNRKDFEQRFSTGEWVSLLEELDGLPKEFLVITEEGIHLSREGLLHADGIAAGLFR